MADNYLENRMADMHRPKGRVVTRRKAPGRPLWIPDIDTVDAATLRALAASGRAVYVSGGEPRSAYRLARALGCRYLQPGMQPPDYAELYLDSNHEHQQD